MRANSITAPWTAVMAPVSPKTTIRTAAPSITAPSRLSACGLQAMG